MLKVQILGAFAAAISAFALAGCGAPVRVAEHAAAPAAEVLPDGRSCRVDGAASSVRIHVFRAGAAARLGHNHVLAVPALSGWVAMPAGRLEPRFELSFRLDEMALDLPEQRAALGPGWASAVSDEAVAATRKNMLGDAVLDAARFPTVRIRSLAVAGEAPRMAVQAEFELHGQRHVQWLPLLVREEAAGMTASGSLVLRQSDFGIKPFSVLGGLLAVRDELVIDFDLRCRF